MEFFHVRAAVSLAILIPSTYLDVKTREVPDRFWVAGSALGLAITAVECLTGRLQVWSVFISIAVGFTLGLALFYLGFFGGADSKALMFLSLTIPDHPPWFKGLTMSTPVPVLTVFNNSLVLSLCYPLTILILNLLDIVRGRNPLRGLTIEGTLRAVLLLATTRRVQFDELEKKVGYYPAEQPTEEGGAVIRKPVYFVRADADKEELLGKLKPYYDRGLYDDGVLVTPTIPFITFITLGFILLPMGDLVLTLVESIL